MFETYNPNRKRQLLEVEIRNATESDIARVVEVSRDREPTDVAASASNIASFLTDNQASLQFGTNHLGHSALSGRFVKFTEEKVASLDKVSALAPEYPNWMPPMIRGQGAFARFQD